MRASKEGQDADSNRETPHNSRTLETTLSPLLPFFDSARGRGEALVLATLIRTAGSTYRKSGAQLLIAASGEYVGLISGGCLEGDLREHARAVLMSGRSRTISYDMRGPDDELWGLGAGCEGAMDILLQRMGPAEQWQPFADVIAQIQLGHRAIATLLIPPATAGSREHPAPTCWIWQLTSAQATPRLHRGDRISAAAAFASAQAQALARGAFDAPQTQDLDLGLLLSLPYAPAPALLLLGAGPDAPPVAQLAAFLGWRVAIYDHRPALLDATRFPPGAALASGAATALRERFDAAQFDAVVVMSHQLNADRDYLRVLAATRCRYVGLLGPAPRREKLLNDLTPKEVQALRPQLHAPVGLDLGGRNPEAIALSIVAGIQAHLHGRRGTEFGRP